MKTQLLKKLTFVFALLAITSLSAQTWTFNSDLEMFAVNFGTHGTIAWDTDGGVGALKLSRTGNNANFGPTSPDNGGGVDADDKEFIKIVIKNLTASTNIRVGGLGATGTGSNANYNVLTANNGAYETHYLDMREVPFWNGVMQNLWIGITGNIGTDTDGAYIDELSVIDISGVPAGLLPEFSEYIANPNFDDPTGIGHMSGGGTNFSRALISTDSQDGANNLEMTFAATPGANGVFTFSSFAQTHSPALVAASTEFTSTMWVKSAKDANIIVRLKINDDGAGGIGGNEELIDDIQPVIGNNTWQMLTFKNTPTMDVEQLNFWFGVEANGDAGDPLPGDVYYFDNMSGAIGAPTLSIKENTLEGVSIYPNPASGLVNVSSLNGGNISVHNILGARVLNETTTSKNHQLNVSSLKSGIYLLRVVSDNKSLTKKLIIR